jgi:hypothetical protein
MRYVAARITSVTRPGTTIKGTGKENSMIRDTSERPTVPAYEADE